MDERPLRVLIVDDEPLSQRRVRALLEERADVEIVGVAGSGREAVALIRAETLDVVFLDVELGDLSGIQVIESIGAEVMPLTVFVTAHDEYAVESFRFEPVDYLLKPFTDARLFEALDRAKRRFGMQVMHELGGQLLAVLHPNPGASRRDDGGATGPGFLDRIAVPMRGRMKIIPVAEIDYIDANGMYSEIHVGDRDYLLRVSLSALEEQLNPLEFFRVHRSHIVRLDRIELLLRDAGGEYRVQLRDGHLLTIGRTRRAELEAVLGRL